MSCDDVTMFSFTLVKYLVWLSVRISLKYHFVGCPESESDGSKIYSESESDYKLILKVIDQKFIQKAKVVKILKVIVIRK